MLPTPLPRRQLLVMMCQWPGPDDHDAAPLVTAEGRLAATWAGNLDAARAGAANFSGLVTLCHSLLFNSGIKEPEAEPHLVKQLLYSGIVKDLGFT